MGSTAWAHLPNAAHIDTALEFVKAHAGNPVWDATWDAARAAALDAARAAAWSATRDAAWIAARNAALDDARNAARGAAWAAAWFATRTAAQAAAAALVAWDYAGELLDKPLVVVEAMAAMDDEAAVLLLPYMTARENITNQLAN